MRPTLVTALAVAVLVSAAGASSAPARWGLHSLRTLGGHYAAASAINARGQVAGWSNTRSGAKHATLWTNGRARDLGTLGGAQSEALALNDKGQVVGTSQTRAGTTHAFFWQNGHMTDLGSRGNLDSAPVAINSTGQVLVEVGILSSAFLWQGGHKTQIGALSKRGQTQATALNDRGQVVGSSFTKGGKQRAFLWENGRMKDLGTLGGPWSYAVAINSSGTVIGSSQLISGFWRGVVWRKGHLTNLGRGVKALRDRTTTPLALNDSGTIVGFCLAIDNAPRPCVWRKDKVSALGPKGERGQAIGINESGQIVGYFKGASFAAHGTSLSSLSGIGKHACVQASAVNERGVIVGSSSSPDCESASHAVEWIAR
jgi:probable HAF family extracellular repeat protein